jgi:hypothetical protein
MHMRKRIQWFATAIIIILCIIAIGEYYVQGCFLGKYGLGIQLLISKKQILSLEKEGKKTIAAHQILDEMHWLLNSGYDARRGRERIRALRAVLKDPVLLEAPDEQSPEDGSWGKWHKEWFWKVVASYDHIVALDERGLTPQYPVRFLDRINSPQALLGYLNALLISEPERDGIKHRREFNESLSVLMRLILRQKPRNYVYHPQLKEALMDFLMNRSRDPETGYWGEWYKSDNRIKKTTDLSITFHIVSFLHGEVPDWPKIIDTTLAIKDRNYPLGWIEGGGYMNHHNMDVAELFRLGWSRATPAQQEVMRIEIRKMLDWCLKESLQPDGSFRQKATDDESLEATTYYGASFLSRIGYFDPQRRFWTQQEFPTSGRTMQRITQFIRKHLDSGGAGGFKYQSALKQMGERSN